MLSALEESAADKALFEAIKTESAPPDDIAPPPMPEPAPEPAPEPPPAEARAPEPAPAPAPEPVPPPPPPAQERQRMVDYGAFHAERQRRQEVERQLAELTKPKEPTVNEDPLGVISRLEQENAAFKEHMRQQAQEQEYALKANHAISQYIAQHPDYNDAANYLHNFRLRQIETAARTGAYNIPMEQIPAIAQQEAKNIFKNALDNGVNPAEAVMELAKVSGWKQSSARSAPSAPVPTAPPIPPVSAAIREAEERVDRLEQGRKIAISSSGSGGRAEEGGPISLERGSALQGAAFDSFVSNFLRENGLSQDGVKLPFRRSRR